MASDDDDPRAPYKVYEGDKFKGTYPTRAEARRAQQRLESEATGSELPRNFIIMDNNVSLCEQPASFSSSYTNVPLSDFK